MGTSVNAARNASGVGGCHSFTQHVSLWTTGRLARMPAHQPAILGTKLVVLSPSPLAAHHDTPFLTLSPPSRGECSFTAFPQPSSPLSVPTGQAWCVADGIHGHRLVSIYGDKHGNRNKHRLFETQRTCYAPEPSGIDISLSLVPSLLTLLLQHLSCSAALAR